GRKLRSGIQRRKNKKARRPSASPIRIILRRTVKRDKQGRMLRKATYTPPSRAATETDLHCETDRLLWRTAKEGTG
ncbi:hypothetical protein M514_02080, partial [Trichuris suis]